MMVGVISLGRVDGCLDNTVGHAHADDRQSVP